MTQFIQHTLIFKEEQRYSYNHIINNFIMILRSGLDSIQQSYLIKAIITTVFMAMIFKILRTFHTKYG